MSHSYYVTLPSNDTSWPENTQSDYRILLPKPLQFGDGYVCGLQSIVYPHTWDSLGTLKDQSITIHGENFTYTVYLPSGAHRNIESVAELINEIVKEETESAIRASQGTPDKRTHKRATPMNVESSAPKISKLNDNILHNLLKKEEDLINVQTEKDKVLAREKIASIIQKFGDETQKLIREEQAKVNSSISHYNSTKNKEIVTLEANLTKTIKDINDSQTAELKTLSDAYTLNRTSKLQALQSSISKLDADSDIQQKKVINDLTAELTRAEKDLVVKETLKTQAEKEWQKKRAEFDRVAPELQKNTDQKSKTDLENLEKAVKSLKEKFDQHVSNLENAGKSLLTLKGQRQERENSKISELKVSLEAEKKRLSADHENLIKLETEKYEKTVDQLKKRNNERILQAQLISDEKKQKLETEIIEYTKNQNETFKTFKQNKENKLRELNEQENKKLLDETVKIDTQGKDRLEEITKDLVKKHEEDKQKIASLSDNKTQNQGLRIFLTMTANGNFDGIWNLEESLDDYPIKFMYDKQTQRIRLSILHPKILYVTLSQQLCYTLGYPLDERIRNRADAKYSPDISGGIKQMMVYVEGVTENVIVGKDYVPLLRIVTVKGQPGDVVEQEFHSPIYVPVAAKEISMINIKIQTMSGRNVPFQSGVVIVILHFRKAVLF